MHKKKYFLPVLSSLLVSIIIIPVFINVETNGKSMLLFQRFWKYGGFVEIVLLIAYAFTLTKLMLSNQKKARNLSWTFFSIVFFSQLLAGLLFCDKCLMTGKLHLPIPAIIIAGPIFRFEIGFMTILFLSTLLISGPAWCSQLCYFGAIENIFVKRKSKKTYSNNFRSRLTIFVIFVSIVLVLRLLKLNSLYATIIAICFAFGSLFVIVFFSIPKGKMFHCTYYCPVGFIVSFYSKLYPIKININNNCDNCGKCVSLCKYSSINFDENQKKMKTTFGCTNCGDCIDVCHSNAISYNFYNNQLSNYKNIWIILSVVIHTVFIAFARI